MVIALAAAALAKALASAVATSVASASLQALTLAAASAHPTPSPALTSVASVAVAASAMTIATAPQHQLSTQRKQHLLRSSIMSTSISLLAEEKPAELLWSCMVTLLRLLRTSELSALARRVRLKMVTSSATRAASSTVSLMASWPRVVTSPEVTAPVASASMETEKSSMTRTSTTST